MVRDIPEQPVDGIIGVRALIDILVAALHWNVWTNLRKDSFGQISATRVLVDKDKPIVLECRRRTKRLRIVVNTIRSAAVWRSCQQERVLL